MQEALRKTGEKAWQKRIKDATVYINNNWDSIEALVKHPHLGCSAKGHVSHILSARLSSRIVVWSLKGASGMAAMRATRANGESAREHLSGLCENATSNHRASARGKKRTHKAKRQDVRQRKDRQCTPVKGRVQLHSCCFKRIKRANGYLSGMWDFLKTYSVLTRSLCGLNLILNNKNSTCL